MSGSTWAKWLGRGFGGSSCNSAHDFASAVLFRTVAAVDVASVKTGVVYSP